MAEVWHERRQVALPRRAIQVTLLTDPIGLGEPAGELVVDLAR